MPFAHCRNVRKDCSVNPHPQPFSHWEKGERLKSVTRSGSGLRFLRFPDFAQKMTPESAMPTDVRKRSALPACLHNEIWSGLRFCDFHLQRSTNKKIGSARKPSSPTLLPE